MEDKKQEAEAKKNEGNEFYKKGEYLKAIDLYSQAIELDPENVAYYNNRAAAKTMARQYVSAIEDCRLALRIDPASYKSNLRAGKCYLALGNFQEAKRQLQTALDGETGTAQKTILQEIQSLDQVQAYLKSTKEALESKDYRRTIYNAEQGLKISPKSSELTLLLIRGYIGQQNYGEATRVANDMVREDVTNADAIYLKGLVLYQQGDNEKAISHFIEALRVDPDHEQSRLQLKKTKEIEKKKAEGNAAFTSGDFEKANELYSEALQIDPENNMTNAKLYSNRATVGSKLKNYDQAIDDCTQALKLDETFLKVYLRRADLYMKKEKYESAIADYQKALELDHGNREIQKALSDAKLELKKSQRKDYYKILEVGKDASDSEIKRAYRKLALQHHPDKNSEDAEVAEAKFKEIGEAYAILSDPQKKHRYDSGADLEEMGGMGGVDVDDIFQMFFQQGGGGFGGFGGSFGHSHGGFGHGHGGSSRSRRQYRPKTNFYDDDDDY